MSTDSRQQLEAHYRGLVARMQMPSQSDVMDFLMDLKEEELVEFLRQYYAASPPGSSGQEP